MPIELIDKIKPKNNGSFPLVDASDVSVNSQGKRLSSVLTEGEVAIVTVQEDVNALKQSVDSIELKSDKVTYDASWVGEKKTVDEALNKLYETLTGVPTLDYVNPSDVQKSFDTGEEISFAIKTTSSVSNSITITVEEKQANGSYRVIKRQQDTVGTNQVSIGVVTEVKRAEYRVSVTDVRGSQGTVVGSDSPYLLFTYTIGGVQLSTNITSVLAEQTLTSGQNWNTFTLQYDLVYAVGNNARLFISCFGDSSDEGIIVTDDISDPHATNILSVASESGKGLQLSVNIKFPKEGPYILKIHAETYEGDTTHSSSEFSNSIVALESNTLYANVVSVKPANPTTNSIVSFEININSTVSYITSNTLLEVNCVATDGTQVIEKSYRGAKIQTPFIWNFGKLESEGQWTYSIAVEPTDGSVITVPTEGVIQVAPYSGMSDISTDALVAWFDASDDKTRSEDGNTWLSKPLSDVSYKSYRIELSNMTHSDRNGWHVDEGLATSYLKLSAGTYGLVYKNDELYRPFETDVFATTTTKSDYTVEFKYKANCSGDYDAVTLSTGASDSATNGFNAGFRKISHVVSGATAELPTAENKWIHACIVFSHQIITDKDIEDNSAFDAADYNQVPCVKVYLNGVLSKYSVLPKLSNNDIYKTCLPFCINGEWSEEGVGKTGDSYIQFIRIYKKALTTTEVIGNYVASITDTVEQETVNNRNSIDNVSIPVVYFLRKNNENSNSFEDLHKITKKKSDDETENTSKNYFVTCKVLYSSNNADDPIAYDNVAVYLQGTSSLLYPVKNYQLKFYSDEALKEKTAIRPLEATWYESSSVYTLKCDYMDQSHKNNTPTAKYYDSVLTKVVESNSTYNYSPAKTVFVTEDGEQRNRYRDTIDGFPVLVYYCDKGLDTKDPSVSDIEFAKENGIYAGTYMFNIDKEGAQLGFEIPVTSFPKTQLANDTSEYIKNDHFQIWKYAGSVDDTTFNGSTREVIGLDPVSDAPCVSYEGASNAQVSAGTFFTLDEYNAYINENRIEITDESGESVVLGAYDKWSDYINATLEPRYTYTEEYEDTDYYEDLTFGHMRRAIEWVASQYQPYSNTNKNLLMLKDDIDFNDVRAEFSNYFSIPYCLTYYLQMLFFTQIDNAGKNAMFDVWYDGVIYPRPYDMDSQMGETNTGEDKVQVSAELPGLSPRQYSGTDSSNRLDDEKHTRFSEYNTSTNRLWNLFARAFQSDITRLYKELRKDVYTTDNVVNAIDSMTTDIIGEYFYNKDATFKYLKLKTEVGEFDSQHLPKLQGSRCVRYEDFLKQRITFLDTYFNYAGDQNTNMTGRSDANNEGYETVTLGLSCYSPQYFRFNIGSGDGTATVYVDPQSHCTIDGKQFNGVSVTLPTIGGNKELELRGVGNLKELFNIESLYLSELQALNATKLLDFNLSNSPRLTTLSVGSNSYLRSIDVSGCTKLTGTLDLRACENLESVDISNTGITSLVLPTDSILSNLNCSNTSLTSLSFTNQPLLETQNIKLDGCSYLSSIEFVNCASIESLDLHDIYALKDIKIEYCSKLTSLNLSGLSLDTVTFNNCNSLTELNLANCRGKAFNELRLAALENLNDLNMNNVANTTTKPLKVLLPSSVKKLDIANSQFAALTTSIEEIESIDCFNFAGMSLTSLKLNANIIVEKIKNLTYSGNLEKLFSGCSNLISVEDCSLTLPPKSSSIVEMFINCKKLESLSKFELTNAEVVENATSAFRYCSKLNYNDAKEFMQKLINLTTARLMFGECFKYETPMTLTDDFLSENKHLSDASYLFYTTGITSIEENLFDSNSQIKTLDMTFKGCSELTAVPSNILEPLTNLKTASGLFTNCNQLEISYRSEDDGKFYLPSTLTNTSAMFALCRKVQIPNIVGTLNQCSNLRDARAMFYYCLNLLPPEVTDISGFLDDCSNIQQIDYMFAKCCPYTSNGTLESEDSFRVSLPSRLVSNTSNTNLISASGLFYDCANLTGVIEFEFFEQTPALKYIGSRYVKDASGGIAEMLFSTGGMFANTHISAFHKDFLSHLKNLEDTSMLFFQGHGGGTSSPWSNTDFANGFNVYMKTSEASEERGLHGCFDGEHTDSDGNYIIEPGIALDLFNSNPLINNVSYMFAGNTMIQGFVDFNNKENS